MFRDEFTCRSCKRDTRIFPGITIRDERDPPARASVCGICLRQTPSLALNALATWLKSRPHGAANG